MEKKRQIIYFRNYFWDFFNIQTDKIKDKIDYVLFLVIVSDKIPKKFFDRITDYEGLYEIKVEFESDIFRVFCCFDEGNIVVLFNGFHKKTQKTPKKEIDRAQKIKAEYFEYKKRECEK